jgi:uncharacterized membrane protein
MGPWLLLLQAVALLGCGALAGLFFGFSTAVMPALAQVPPAQAAAVMNAVNRLIQNPRFFALFMGTALACAALVVFTFARPGLGTAGAVLFLAGVFGVTVVVNVPLNNRLAAGADWATFAPRWVRWNLVRGVASALAALLMLPALVHGG